MNPFTLGYCTKWSFLVSVRVSSRPCVFLYIYMFHVQLFTNRVFFLVQFSSSILPPILWQRLLTNTIFISFNSTNSPSKIRSHSLDLTESMVFSIEEKGSIM